MIMDIVHFLGTWRNMGWGAALSLTGTAFAAVSFGIVGWLNFKQSTAYEKWQSRRRIKRYRKVMHQMRSTAPRLHYEDVKWIWR